MKHFFLSVLLLMSSMVHASEVEIVSAEAECDKGRYCLFRATLRHADSGWNHYANLWQVMTTDGKLLVKRVLYHPHVNEQPFTRNSARIHVPASIKQVVIMAGDLPNGINSKPYKLNIP